MARKIYVLDTNVLLDNPKSIEILRNGEENIIFLSQETIEELDGLKKNPRVNFIVKEVVDELLKFGDEINILESNSNNRNDNKILDDILHSKDPRFNEYPMFFVTNDKLLQFKAKKKGILTQEFKDSNPYKSESQKYTGFIDINKEELVTNCFYWQEGILHFYDGYSTKQINYENEIWKVKPRTPYQNAAFDLILNDKIDLITIQSEAGMGKNMIAQASALYKLLEKKNFDKIIVFRPNSEAGNELGFLPGDMDEKMDPYFRPIKEMFNKLHKMREANRIYIDGANPHKGFNIDKVELLPINYIRGSNITDAFVIVDEIQQFSRTEMRLILSRMGENVKCVCLGDVMQIDNPHLNQSYNGMTWTTKLLKGSENYGHIVLSGKKSRGPIASLILNKGL